MKFILGKKLGMTQLFTSTGATLAVTLVEAGPCTVVQVKSREKDGYLAVQLGFEPTAKRLSKAQHGRLKDLAPFRHLREFRLMESANDLKRGSVITVAAFAVGDKVKVTSDMKGRGFQGGVKRHGFSGGPKSHGHRHVLRTIGSIGASTPEKVWKGKRMPGHYGDTQVSVRNLKVAAVAPAQNLLALTGAVPGSRGALVRVVGK